MKIRDCVFVSAIGFVAWSPAVFAEPAAPVQAPPSTQAAASPDQDRIVCRVMGPPTGSRLGSRRECKTQKEWDYIQKEQQDRITQMQQRALTSGVIGQ
jgi:hypothetical protein